MIRNYAYSFSRKVILIILSGKWGFVNKVHLEALLNVTN